jgi:hypothetical protein
MLKEASLGETSNRPKSALESGALSSEQYENAKFQASLKLFRRWPDLQKDTINYLRTYLKIDISNYSQDIQRRYVEELQSVIDDLRDFDDSMIPRLRSIREWMSFWMEKEKPPAYYKSMILSRAIEKRAILIHEAVKIIAWPALVNPDARVGSFNERDYKVWKARCYQLDEALGCELFEKIDPNKIYSLKWNFCELMKWQIDPNDPRYTTIQDELKRIQTSGLDRSEWLFQNLRSVTLRNRQKVDLWSHYTAYDDTLNAFKKKNFFFQAWNRQMKEEKKWFGFDRTITTYGKVWYDTLENMFAEKLGNVESMSPADLVIMLRVLFSVVPVAGDVLGWYDDIRQANAGINFDGSIQWVSGNILSYLTGALGLTIAGGVFAKIAKWPKYVKVIAKISEVVNQLSKSGWLEQLAKNEQVMKMLEAMSGVVPNTKDLLTKIKNTTTAATQKAVSKTQETVRRAWGVVKSGIRVAGEAVNDSIEWAMKRQGLVLNAVPDSMQKFGKDAEIISEPFDPKKEFALVRSAPKSEREKALKEFKEKLKIQQENLMKIPEDIRMSIDPLDFSTYSVLQVFDLTEETIRRLSPEIKRLSPEQQAIVWKQIREYIKKKYSSHLFVEKYKNNPKWLIAEHSWISPDILAWEVQMEVNWANIVFYVDPIDYNKVLTRWADMSVSSEWVGVFDAWSKRPWLEWSVVILSWRKWTQEVELTRGHELRHANNYFMMPERLSDTLRFEALTRWKDEIIAFIQWWTPFEKIRVMLNGEKGSYNYFIYLMSKYPDAYSKLRSSYQKDINRYIDVAERLIKKWVSLDLLSTTPVEKWYQLERLHNLKLKKSIVFKVLENGMYEWEQMFDNWYYFRWIFNRDGNLISWLKDYWTFKEQWTFDTKWYLNQWYILWIDGTRIEWIFIKNKLAKWNMDSEWTSYEWIFERWGLVEWRIKFSDGGIIEWIFKDWNIVRWRIKVPWLAISEWDFNWGLLHWQWRAIYPDGMIQEGAFENWRLINGKTTYWNWYIDEWDFIDWKLHNWLRYSPVDYSIKLFQDWSEQFSWMDILKLRDKIQIDMKIWNTIFRRLDITVSPEDVLKNAQELQKCELKFQDRWLHQLSEQELLSDHLLEKVVIETTIEPYTLFMNKKIWVFMISNHGGQKQIRYNTLDDFIQWIKQFRNDPESLFQAKTE